MNKKVDKEFKYIHDEYLLQCICTELKDKIEILEKDIKILWDVCCLNDTYMTTYQNEIFDKYYDKFYNK